MPEPAIFFHVSAIRSWCMRLASSSPDRFCIEPICFGRQLQTYKAKSMIEKNSTMIGHAAFNTGVTGLLAVNVSRRTPPTAIAPTTYRVMTNSVWVRHRGNVKFTSASPQLLHAAFVRLAVDIAIRQLASRDQIWRLPAVTAARGRAKQPHEPDQQGTP